MSAAVCALALWLGGLSCVSGCAAEAIAAGHDERAPRSNGGASRPLPEPTQSEHPARELDCCVALLTAKAVTNESAETQPASGIAFGDAPISCEDSPLWTHDATPPELSPLSLHASCLRIEILRI